MNPLPADPALATGSSFFEPAWFFTIAVVVAAAVIFLLERTGASLGAGLLAEARGRRYWHHFAGGLVLGATWLLVVALLPAVASADPEPAETDEDEDEDENADRAARRNRTIASVAIVLAVSAVLTVASGATRVLPDLLFAGDSVSPGVQVEQIGNEPSADPALSEAEQAAARLEELGAQRVELEGELRELDAEMEELRATLERQP